MTTFKKVSAMICSAAAALTIGAALAASAMQTAAADVTKIYAEEKTAVAGETVAYSLTLEGNNGYSNLSLTLNYDLALTAVTTDPDLPRSPKIDEGPAVAGLNVTTDLNSAVGIFAMSTMGQKMNKTDGLVCTVYFTVPADAEEGTVYPMKLLVDDFNDIESTQMPIEAFDGYIKIVKPGETTDTTSSKGSDTTTTTDTTPSGGSETTTASSDTKPGETTTLSSSSSDGGTTTTVSSSSEGGQTTTTTNGNEKNTTSVTSPTKGGGKGTDKPVKGPSTGDAGTGLAAAGLMAAICGAIFVTAKKKD